MVNSIDRSALIRSAPNAPQRQASPAAIKYFVLFIVIMLSGNPAAMSMLGGVKLALPLLLVVELAALIMLNRANDIVRYSLPLIPWFLLEIYHLLDGNPFSNVLGVLCRLLAAYLICLLLREEFVPMFIKIMCFLSWLSFPFFLMLAIEPPITSSGLLQSVSNIFGANTDSITLLLHTYQDTGDIRNSGCFWEPGAFGGYLMLAIMLLGDSNNGKPFKGFKNQFILLSVALLTTTSTTAYVAYFVYLVYMVSTRMVIRNMVRIVFILPVIAIGIWYTMFNATFLYEKIQKQYSMTEDQSYGWEITRFGSLLYDYYHIEQKPFLGWGSYTDLRATGGAEDIISGKGNGFSEFTVRNGVIGTLIYFMGVFLYMYRLSGMKKLSAAIMVLLVITLLQGEVFLNYPLFLSLMFFGFINPQPTPAAATAPGKAPNGKKNSRTACLP